MRILFTFSAILALGYAAPQYAYDHSTSPARGQGGNRYLPPPAAEQAPTISKLFYIVSAPEDNSNDGIVKKIQLGRPQRNYRVVFIKAPDSGNGNVKYSAEFAPQEEKTIIYVLTKKENELSANDIATPAPPAPSKPEIHFIKYRTEDEAQNAQREIQSEYDKLGGTSEVEEDSAPVSSVIGSLDGLNPDGSYNYHQVNSGASNLAQPLAPPHSHPSPVAPSSQYLPSAFKI